MRLLCTTPSVTLTLNVNPTFLTPAQTNGPQGPHIYILVLIRLHIGTMQSLPPSTAPVRTAPLAVNVGIELTPLDS